MSESTGSPPKRKQDEKRDVEVDDSFPASDPPSTTPVTGPGGEETTE
ncbi:MAG: hypothetical protein JOZ42_05560 [Acetobacteraceae bacterium]|nr:hypothetical protein [Acetobacteraceae bacterium]